MDFYQSYREPSLVPLAEKDGQLAQIESSCHAIEGEGVLGEVNLGNSAN